MSSTNPLEFVERLVSDTDLDKALDIAVANIQARPHPLHEVGIRIETKLTQDGISHFGDAVLMPFFPEGLDKDIRDVAVYEVAKTVAQDSDAIPYMITLFSDAWMLHRPLAPSEKNIRSTSDKIECFIVVVSTLDGRIAFSILPYFYDEESDSFDFPKDDIVVGNYSKTKLRITNQTAIKEAAFDSRVTSAFWSGVVDYIFNDLKNRS